MNKGMESIVEKLFEQAFDMDAGDRQKFLDGECAGNPALKHELEQLLCDAEAADAYFGHSFAGKSLIDEHPKDCGYFETSGSTIGPYELDEIIGEGGFGIVWLARQTTPISRQVAIKVIKAGMDTKEVLSRFDAERQALARMDHPNIARVLDAGTTSHGRPYFAMEWVRGIPITRFCEEHALDAEKRLRLFVEVCSGINHAHQKGVIHRDIKPSNVLVTMIGEVPQVKIIDFGISKATEGKLTDRTFMTRFEQWLGTPIYMSPEQAGLGGLDVDTRSDIYSLGVLLYEILTGVPPFDQKTMMLVGMDEMRRIIREVEPLRPSVRVTTLHADKKDGGKTATSKAVRIFGKIPSDLDWIVMRAMEKSRDRRYATAAAFADDIRNFLADEPVIAQPPNARYLVGKFLRRHRRGLKIIVGVAIILIATTVFSLMQALKAGRAEALAESRLDQAVAERNAKARALDDAEAISRLLTEVFKRPDPDLDGSKVTVMEALDKTSRQLDAELSKQPLRQAMLKKVLAGTYEQLGLNAQAMKLWDEILVIYRKEFGSDHVDTITTLRKVIEYCERDGQYDRVLELATEEDEAIARQADRSYMERLSALRSQSEAHYRKGNVDLAKRMQEEMKVRLAKEYGPYTHELTVCDWFLRRYQNPPPRGNNPEVNNQAIHFAKETTGEPSWKRKEKEYFSIRAKYGERHLRTIDALRDLSQAQFDEKTIDEALVNFGRAYKIAREEFGNDHSVTLDFQSGLAHMNYGACRWNEALSLQHSMVNILRDRVGGKDLKTLDAEDLFLRWLFNHAEFDQGRNFLQNAYERRVKELGADSVKTLRLENAIVFKLFCAGKIEEALPHAEHAVALLRVKLGNEDRLTADAISNLARCYTHIGKGREAMKLFEECCPHARDDTFINFILAQLQVWYGNMEGYHATRRWMIDYALSEMHRFVAHQDILRRVVYISCVAPLENAEQGEQIQRIMDRVNVIQDSNSHILDLANGNVGDFMPLGMMQTRLGNHEQAIRCYDEFSKGLPYYKQFIWNRWDQCAMQSFKVISLLGLGRREEARQLLEETGKLIRPLKCEDEPMLGEWAPGGQHLLQRVAYREAKRLLDATTAQ